MADPRVHPLVDVDVAAVIAAVTGDRVVASEPIGGGITNTLHRVTTARAVLGVKTFASDGLARERMVIERLAGVVPVPELAGVHGRSLVYRWIDGVTLNDARRRGDDLHPLAAPIGRMLAAIAQATLAPTTLAPATLAPTTLVPTTLAPATSAPATPAAARVDLPRRARGPVAERLATPLVRARLGDALADAVARGFADLPEPAGEALVHGDFLGRNLLVNGGAVVGVIDWEAACIGSPLWDVGNLFRYGKRYDARFRDDLALAYRAAGGALPASWWQAARWLDAARLVGVLAEPRELPTVFEDCRALLDKLVAERFGGTLGP